MKPGDMVITKTTDRETFGLGLILSKVNVANPPDDPCFHLHNNVWTVWWAKLGVSFDMDEWILEVVIEGR